MIDSYSPDKRCSIRGFSVQENVTIRVGRPDDAPDFSELVLFTGPELLPALFGSESNVRNVMRGSFRHVKNSFSYEHSHFIEMNGETTGMGQVFTYDQMKKEQIRTMLFIFRYLKLIFFTQIIYMYRSSNILVQITEGDAYLAHLAVYPKFRSQGYGALLLETLEREAQAAGCKRMILDVETYNEKAIEFYRRLGYGTESRPPIFRIKDHEFEFFKMSKDIEAV
jgi:GNAT superfamily N-acetyltransferase